MRTTKLFLWLILVHLIPVSLMGQSQQDLLFSWDFDDKKKIYDPAYVDLEEKDADMTVKEGVHGTFYEIHGLGEYVPGVEGSAFKFDGFSSYIQGAPRNGDGELVEMPRKLSVESWVALGAYPWNWSPILSIGKFNITGFYLGVDAQGRVGFHMSDGTNVWHECNSQVDPDTHLGLDLRKWYHVVATYSPSQGIKLYLNGELVNTYDDYTFDYGITYSELEEGFRLGMNKDPMAPTDPVRTWATHPSQYTLVGIIDETKIYSKVLSPDEVEQKYASTTPEHEPRLEERDFPSVEGYDDFTADYTRLEYYPGWDGIWPPGDHMDVVVQFDRSPVKMMFWRGSRYSPAWVSENGKWMADQSRETGNNWFLNQGSAKNMPTGCIEHMSDAKTRSSRVSIIENHDARITVNWRYRQMDVKYKARELPNNTGFGEWGNEDYYIYPDAVAVRSLEPGIGGWQETIFFNEPGTRPEDNIHLDAVTLMNLEGESKTYSWEDGYPKFDLEGANIQIINLKSEYKPFLIFVEGGGFDVFDLEVRPEYSHFPWWNHWPVAQVESDGRYAQAKDRASHSSLSWGAANANFALYGMAKDKDRVLKIARSWYNPPALSVTSNGFNSQGYKKSERAYIVQASGNDSFSFSLAGSEQSPVFNPVLKVKGWAPDDLSVTANGQKLDEEQYEFGVERNVNGHPTTMVWLKYDAREETSFELNTEN